MVCLAWAGATGATDRAALPRTISLAPHLTEIVFAIGAGDALVGAVDWSDYPLEATRLPSIGSAFQLDLERIVVLDSELALAWEDGTPAAYVQQLEALGIRVEVFRTRRLDEIATTMLAVGSHLGHERQARLAVERFRTAIARIERIGPHDEAPRRVFYQVENRPLYTLGGGHVINEVLALCGMVNIFADIDQAAAVVDPESVLAGNPDLILVSADSPSSEALAPWNEVLVLPEQVEVIQVNPDLLVRPTPRIVDGIEWLCRR